MRILVVNAGSSTMKLSALDGERLVEAVTIESPGGQADEGRLQHFIGSYGPFDAVGHRVVHGGTDFTQPVLVTDDVVRKLESLTSLAPLHLPGSLAGLAVMGRLLADVPAVACFDTAFHASIPPAASTYALPEEWRRRWGLRRYGFHGLSHAYASRRAREMTGAAEGDAVRTVTCHLGAGASLAAVSHGACADTTMGFTPLEGLVMATRSGTVDPGLVLWLAQHAGVRPADISDQLEHHSGLSGLAGTGDMRDVLAAEAQGDEPAALAMGVYVHRLAALTGSMMAAIGGLDVLVFTGGVGEHAPEVRRRAVEAFAFLGAGLDEEANGDAHPDCEVSAAGSRVRTLVVTAREDLEIARGVEAVLAG
jgi:acetate kinase